MIYVKTEFGQSAFQNRSVFLTPRQRAAFIMFDGKRDSTEVIKATAGIGVTQDDLKYLVISGMLLPNTSAPLPGEPDAFPASAAASVAPSSFKADGGPTDLAMSRYSKAYPIATRLTSELGLRGFRLNLAVESASSLDKLKELAPQIRQAVGPEKFLELSSALDD